MLRKLLKDEAGFTLIELLIVVVIIGILAAVGVPIYSRYITSARASEAPTILMALVEYIESYSRAHPTNPFGGLTDAVSMPPGGPGAPADSTNWLAEVVGDDGVYFTYAWNNPALTATGTVAPFGAADVMTVTFNADGDVNTWVGAGSLADVTPD